MLEVTREKTEMVMTQRYASPPVRRGDDSFQEILLMSSRNDVYSLGLVIWELVERKVVLGEFGAFGIESVGSNTEYF
ncbi:unnamed protein product, partial [Mesorhabditis belari]|uniref:Protein kinase domain-containing protein n=1 Tax=Mesorhabditis belari TaxID=2138241 RepID=A0AAF3F5R3_9BILA